MPILTLTTDLGLRDPHVAAVKGNVLRLLPSANIIDITHQVQPFHIAEAAFILRNCYAAFPRETVHLIAVDANTNNRPRFLLVRAGGFYFLAQDNGLLSLCLHDEHRPEGVWELPFTYEDLNFPLQSILLPAAGKLFAGTAPSEIGSPIQDWVQMSPQRPLLSQSLIRGSVIYIDRYGNAITNIEREHLLRDGKMRSNVIYLNRREYFDEICQTYQEVEEGEKLCLFGSSGFLEIAINKGSAHELLGLREGSNVIVEFDD